MGIIKIITCLMWLAISNSCQARELSCAGRPNSAREFVKEFYHWYVPIALRDNSELSWSVAVKERKNFFKPNLAGLLREDSISQAKANGEIVGLDFDPFLNSQDPGGSYVVNRVNYRKGSFFVDVGMISLNKSTAQTVVTAQVDDTNKKCQFSNFFYPNGDNAISILNLLENNRKLKAKIW